MSVSCLDVWLKAQNPDTHWYGKFVIRLKIKVQIKWKKRGEFHLFVICWSRISEWGNGTLNFLHMFFRVFSYSWFSLADCWRPNLRSSSSSKKFWKEKTRTLRSSKLMSYGAFWGSMQLAIPPSILTTDTKARHFYIQMRRLWIATMERKLILIPVM